MSDSEERARLHEEISVATEQAMEAMGGGTLMLPEPIQRGMQEAMSPRLDVDGLRELRDELQRLLAHR